MIAPLAERMRPKVIDHYVGQQHLVGPQGAIRPILKTRTTALFDTLGPTRNGKNNFGYAYGES